MTVLQKLFFKAIISLASIVYAGFFTLAIADNNNTHQITKAERRAIETAVKEDLNDPESARFGRMSATESEDGGVVNICGWVSAKNGFGGYGQKIPYHVVLLQGKKPDAVMISSGSEGITHDMCAQLGMVSF